MIRHVRWWLNVQLMLYVSLRSTSDHLNFWPYHFEHPYSNCATNTHCQQLRHFVFSTTPGIVFIHVTAMIFYVDQIGSKQTVNVYVANNHAQNCNPINQFCWPLHYRKYRTSWLWHSILILALYSIQLPMKKCHLQKWCCSFLMTDCSVLSVVYFKYNCMLYYYCIKTRST